MCFVFDVECCDAHKKQHLLSKFPSKLDAYSCNIRLMCNHFAKPNQTKPKTEPKLRHLIHCIESTAHRFSCFTGCCQTEEACRWRRRKCCCCWCCSFLLTIHLIYKLIHAAELYIVIHFKSNIYVGNDITYQVSIWLSFSVNKIHVMQIKWIWMMSLFWMFVFFPSLLSFSSWARFSLFQQIRIGIVELTEHILWIGKMSVSSRLQRFKHTFFQTKVFNSHEQFNVLWSKTHNAWLQQTHHLIYIFLWWTEYFKSCHISKQTSCHINICRTFAFVIPKYFRN